MSAVMQIDTDALRPQARFARAVTGPSYRPGFRWMVISTLLSLGAYAARVLTERPADAPDIAPHVAVLSAAAAVLLLVNAWFMVFGRTTVDAHGIRRSGLFGNEVRWEQISRASLLRVPFSPRLVVMPVAGPMRAFHAGNAELEAAFREIEQIYRPGG